jgi:hypothetical protein
MRRKLTIMCPRKRKTIAFCASAILLAVTVAVGAQAKPPAQGSAIAAPPPAPIKIGSLTVSGSLRARFESWDWFATSAAHNSYNFGAATLRLALRADVHHLRLSNANDQWYLGGGAFQPQTFGYTGRPSNGRKTLGTLVDLSAD